MNKVLLTVSQEMFIFLQERNPKMFKEMITIGANYIQAYPGTSFARAQLLQRNSVEAAGFVAHTRSQYLGTQRCRSGNRDQFGNFRGQNYSQVQYQSGVHTDNMLGFTPQGKSDFHRYQSKR